MEDMVAMEDMAVDMEDITVLAKGPLTLMLDIDMVVMEVIEVMEDMEDMVDTEDMAVVMEDIIILARDLLILSLKLMLDIFMVVMVATEDMVDMAMDMEDTAVDTVDMLGMV